MDYLVIDEAGQSVTRGRTGDGHRGEEHDPARRPVAALPGFAGRAPVGSGARCSSTYLATTRRSHHGAACLPRPHRADAPRRLPLRLRGGLRGHAYPRSRSARTADRLRRPLTGTGVRSILLDTRATRALARGGHARSRPRSDKCSAVASPRRRHHRACGQGDFMVVTPTTPRFAAYARSSMPGAASRGCGWHSRQVSGPGGGRRVLLDGDVLRRGDPDATSSSSTAATG